MRVKVLNETAEQRKLKCRTESQDQVETEHTMFAEQTVEALFRRQERQALVTVADGNRVQDPEGDKCKKVAGFSNRATDFVAV